MTKKIYVDEFVCLPFISTEGTYHLQFGKCARFPIFPYTQFYDVIYGRCHFYIT